MGDGEHQWVRASRCYGHGDCVEIAPDGREIIMRDSKNPHGPQLRFSRSGIADLIELARRGEFNHLLR